jgi:putative nucleotidyltransferase with HDIG domain
LESALNFYHPDDEKLIREMVERCRDEGKGWDCKLRIYNLQGQLCWTRSIGEAEYEGDEVVAVFGLIQDITASEKLAEEHSKLETIRSLVLHSTASMIGEDFLINLVASLGAAMGAKYAFVALLNDEADSASTIALWSDEGVADNFSYKLADTPCEKTTANGLCLYARNIQQLFPKDKMLCDMGCESYVGATLYGSQGEMLGIMVMLDDKPIEDEPLVGSVLSLFSGRAGSELERLSARDNLISVLRQTVQAIAQTVEHRDPYTAGHQRRVAELVVAIADEMGLKKDRIEGMRLGAIIHDIGKIGVPAELLSRPGKLNKNEFAIIKSHAHIGREIIKDIDFPWPVVEMVAQHHERLDGSGYPEGLSGSEIILESRILAVADTVEAITAFRPYRPARGLAVALEEIEKNSGILYDPLVVEACLSVIRDKGFEW